MPINLTRISRLSGKEHTREINITVEQLAEWMRGSVLIQDAFPHLSADDREFILTGATPEEWEEAFGSEDEDGTEGLPQVVLPDGEEEEG